MLTIPRIPVLKQNNDLESKVEMIFDNTVKLCDSFDSCNRDRICADTLQVIQSAMGLLLKLSDSKLDMAKHLLRHELRIKEEEAQGKEQILAWINLTEKEY